MPPSMQHFSSNFIIETTNSFTMNMATCSNNSFTIHWWCHGTQLSSIFFTNSTTKATRHSFATFWTRHRDNINCANLTKNISAAQHSFTGSSSFSKFEFYTFLYIMRVGGGLFSPPGKISLKLFPSFPFLFRYFWIYNLIWYKFDEITAYKRGKSTKSEYLRLPYGAYHVTWTCMHRCCVVVCEWSVCTSNYQISCPFPFLLVGFTLCNFH